MNMSRKNFLRWSAITTGGIVFGTALPACGGGGGGGSNATAAAMPTATPTAIAAATAPTQAQAPAQPATGPVTIAASLAASRVTGVAPLYVNFDATGTTHYQSTNPTHELFYSWIFGDTGAGNWANGVQSAGLISKNAAFGPITGHVFETPGTYTVNLIVMDGVNMVSKNVTITVQDPNVVYAGANTICISSSGNFTGAPAGSVQYTAPSSDMLGPFNTYKASNKRLLFCKSDTWTCTNLLVFTNLSSMTVGGFGSGGASATFGSGTMVSVTPSAINDALFSCNAGNSDIRICNFKIAANSNTSAVSLNNSISQAMLYKVEIRGGSQGFNAYPGDSGTNNVFDQSCYYECLVDNLYGTPFIDSIPSLHGGIGAFVGLVRGGVMGCYFDSCNHGEQTLRIPFIDRGHINNNYIARPNQTKNALKIHSFAYNEVALYSEKFMVSGNVIDLRSGYSWNGTTVTEVGDCSMVIGNGGTSGNERVRNGIVENNYTYGCRSQPKTLAFGSFNCPNMTIRNNIADFLLGASPSAFVTTYGYTTSVFAYVTTSTPDPTIGVRIYNNSLYCNVQDATSPMVWISNANTSQVIVKNNLSYQPYIGYWADKIVYVDSGATVAAYTASNNTTNQTNNPNFVATPPISLTDWRPNTGSYAINTGTNVPVYRDFNQATRIGSSYDMGAVLP